MRRRDEAFPWRLRRWYHYTQIVGPAVRQHPGPWRHLMEAGDANGLYYSQTRFRQEAGYFGFIDTWIEGGK